MKLPDMTVPETLRYENQLIVAEGDFVVTHGRFSGNGRPAMFGNRFPSQSPSHLKQRTRPAAWREAKKASKASTTQ